MSNIDDLINSIKDMPAMPNVIMRALNIVKDPESSIKELASIISYDQSLSTKVLTLVNSAYYGFPQQITSINRALALLGMMKSKNIIVTVAMKPMLINQGDKELWIHSIKTAVGCEYLASYLKLMDPDEAFVIGFLHDIGRIILSLKDAKLCEKVKQVMDEGGDLIETERTFFGTDHAQMGAILAKKWQLPILLTNTIKYHHNPNLSSMPTACTLVYIVDKLVQDVCHFEQINSEIMKNLDINIVEPQILRENILQRAELLLQELAN